MKNLDKGISQIVFPNKDMAEPERPDPPCVDKVTHCSIELSWGGAGPEGDAKGDGRRKYCVQEEEEGKDREYGTVYNGFAINHVFRGLEPNTTYHYRIRVSNNHGCSAWSASISVSTTKVPLTGQDIHKAIVNWEVEKVKHILDESDDSLVNVPDAYGMSPLMIASQKGYTSIVEILIERGADVNYVSGSGKTSLMLACFGGHLKVATILHEHGVILTYKDNGGSNALHWAVDGDRDDCIRWLLNCGVKLLYQSSAILDLLTALFKLYIENTSTSPNLCTLPCAQPRHALCTNELSINLLLLCDTSVIATVDGSEHTARTLLDYGADVNKRDKTGRTALMAAALNGNLRLCQLLIQHGADQTLTNEVSIKASSGTQGVAGPLCVRSPRRPGSPRMASRLFCDKNGRTCLDFAESFGRKKVPPVRRPFFSESMDEGVKERIAKLLGEASNLLTSSPDGTSFNSSDVTLNALARARQMLSQSSSAGVNRRLNSREWLRSVRPQAQASKQREPKKMALEFALLSCLRDEENEDEPYNLTWDSVLASGSNNPQPSSSTATTNDTTSKDSDLTEEKKKNLVHGRKLDIEDESHCEEADSETNFICVDEHNLLSTSGSELSGIQDHTLTFEVEFIGEMAKDLGGPSKEWIRLMNCAIKEKYFDQGLRQYLSDDHYYVGIMIGIALLPNGQLPAFMQNEAIDQLLVFPQVDKCIANIQRGLKVFGLCTIINIYPTLLHLLGPSTAKLSSKMLIQLLKPTFSEGSSAYQKQKQVYALFVKYIPQVSNGQRELISLASILIFVTGAAEEPVLGFVNHPHINFQSTEDVAQFLMTAGQCKRGP
ncbi:predicted protein [Nematostella vectensis]|uniref:Fibronectin type-III domain-containing protein n=1 Tax=Nematostella vectensis TaxID=45351 RepID=A7RH71_NEMVE|nr:predicted protein [Nematostella vectensis]|eukprot:XP_001641367.1 predicted protein [Nematostella vectensis]